jgi:predicted secreted Zn-dependent protease
MVLSGVAACAAGDLVKVKTYAVTGTSGLELYESIGRNGPRDGDNAGSIAQTVMDLKWNRLFDERGGDCYLVRLRPSLSITMILPKPEAALAGKVKADWQRFSAGIRAHEDVHVEMIGRFVEEAQKAAAGAMMKKDKSCAKVKAEVSRRLDEAHAAHKARSRAFDRAELGPDGTVQKLVFDLVRSR